MRFFLKKNLKAATYIPNTQLLGLRCSYLRYVILLWQLPRDAIQVVGSDQELSFFLNDLVNFKYYQFKRQKHV
jgi:hypothetical protein